MDQSISGLVSYSLVAIELEAGNQLVNLCNILVCLLGGCRPLLFKEIFELGTSAIVPDEVWIARVGRKQLEHLAVCHCGQLIGNVAGQEAIQHLLNQRVLRLTRNNILLLNGARTHLLLLLLLIVAVCGS